MANNPINQFPANELPTIIRQAVQEVQANIKAPLPLIVASALSACSLASQHAINVKRPQGQVSPVSLFFVTLAESGERKSTVDNLFIAPIRTFQQQEAEKHLLAINQYKPVRQAWEAERKGVTTMIERLAGKGQPAETQKQRLIEIMAQEPAKPRLIKLLYDDTTPAALKLGLNENSQSIALWSDEAGSIFNGRGLSDLAALNKLWDGGEITVDRSSSDSFTVRNGRVTIAMMLQRSVMEKYLERKGEEARGIGFFARCLITEPESTQGTRFIEYAQTSWQYLPIFQRCLTRILMEGSHFGDTKTKPICLEFSQDAQSEWIKAYNHIESKLSAGEYLSDVKDFAAKLADNIARLAALFHWVEEKKGDISQATVCSAIQIMYWYADEFIRLFAADQTPKEVRDAEELAEWLLKKYRDRGLTSHKKTDIRKFGPTCIRNKIWLDAALDVLCREGIVRYLVDYRGTTHVNVSGFWLDLKQNPLPALPNNWSGNRWD